MLSDFMPFWAVARLLLTHGNPYSSLQIVAVMSAVEPSKAASVFMYYPPWTLPFFLPFGWLDHSNAQFLWFLLHSLIIFLGGKILWQHYAGAVNLSRASWLALLTFTPIYFVLLLGQIAPFVLAAVIGFLRAARNQSWYWAGAWIAIASIKPHLLYLLWIVLALWVLRDRRWQVAVGFVVTFVILATVPALIDGQIYSRYLNLMTDPKMISPMGWANPTIGTVANQILGGNKIWLRWLPVVAGVVWLMGYGGNMVQVGIGPGIPLVVLVSVVTTPYSWTYDYVVLLPAVLQAVTWYNRAINRQQASFVLALYLGAGATLDIR